MSSQKILLSLTLLLSSLSFSLDALSIEKQRFGINAGIQLKRYKEQLDEPNRSKERGFQHQVGINYNLLMNKWLYLGFDLSGATGEVVYDGSNSGSHYRSKSDHSFFNTELRLGYYWAREGSVLIPFVGYGYHSWRRTIAPHETLEQKLDYKLPYLAAGLRYTLNYGEYTTMGVKVQLAKAISPRVKNHTRALSLKLGNTLITELEAPISYSNPSLFTGNIALIPFFQWVNSKKSTVSSGYSHAEAKTFDTGFKIEYFYML